MNSGRQWLSYLASTVIITVLGMGLLSFSGVVHAGTKDTWVVWPVVLGVIAAIVGTVFLFPIFTNHVRGRLWVLVFLLAGAPTGGLLGLWGVHVKHAIRSNGLAAAHLDKHLSEYLAENAEIKAEKDDYLCGKVVILDTDTNDFADLQFELPADLTPKDAAEVGSVVKVTWKQNQVGKYDNGAIGYQWEAHAIVYDLTKHMACAEFVVEGSEPPRTTKSTSSESGSKPMTEIVTRLGSIPQRPL